MESSSSPRTGTLRKRAYQFPRSARAAYDHTIPSFQTTAFLRGGAGDNDNSPTSPTSPIFRPSPLIANLEENPDVTRSSERLIRSDSAISQHDTFRRQTNNASRPVRHTRTPNIVPNTNPLARPSSATRSSTAQRIPFRTVFRKQANTGTTSQNVPDMEDFGTTHQRANIPCHLNSRARTRTRTCSSNIVIREMDEGVRGSEVGNSSEEADMRSTPSMNRDLVRNATEATSNRRSETSLETEMETISGQVLQDTQTHDPLLQDQPSEIVPRPQLHILTTIPHPRRASPARHTTSSHQTISTLARQLGLEPNTPPPSPRTSAARTLISLSQNHSNYHTPSPTSTPSNHAAPHPSPSLTDDPPPPYTLCTRCQCPLCQTVHAALEGRIKVLGWRIARWEIAAGMGGMEGGEDRGGG